MSASNLNEYSKAEHARKYLARADRVPHRAEGESLLLEIVPKMARRILDLGTGNGRLIALLRVQRPEAEFVGIDFSPTMLAAARERFHAQAKVQILEHNMDNPLPDLGRFDAVVSSLAIHHCVDERKQGLYSEIHTALKTGGIFCNLEHVAPASPLLHEAYLDAFGITKAEEDPSNKLACLQTQLQWLRDIGFRNVDCHWKWLELALFGGSRKR